uniref:Uncharacterized protein n=1 Tax=Serinus canaria TaxID=9135 RepID=A0A8C9L680_SERCA
PIYPPSPNPNFSPQIPFFPPEIPFLPPKIPFFFYPLNPIFSTSEWLRFFEDAGIPPGPALGYAVAFVDNRIHKNMLLDLTKELMKELGITVVGDIIAILRHAKVVHRQEPPPNLPVDPRRKCAGRP